MFKTGQDMDRGGHVFDESWGKREAKAIVERIAVVFHNFSTGCGQLFKTKENKSHRVIHMLSTVSLQLG
jgi:hypothetical protein